jgi:hypothetical protein
VSDHRHHGENENQPNCDCKVRRPNNGGASSEPRHDWVRPNGAFVVVAEAMMSALYFERLAFGGWNVSIIWLHNNIYFIAAKFSVCFVFSVAAGTNIISRPNQKVHKETKRSDSLSLFYFIRR